MSHRNLIAYENQIIKYKSEIERLNLIHSTMPDLLWEINNRFAFSYISSNVKKILGYESHDMVGVSLFDFIDAKGKDEIINKFKQILLKDNETLFMKLIMIHKDGSKINFEMNGSPFYKKSGSIL
jgi:PAS domain S-box-containing protein